MKEQIQTLVGKRAAYGFANFALWVKITDVKESYGKTRIQIVPEAGTGSKWVNLDSVTFPESFGLPANP